MKLSKVLEGIEFENPYNINLQSDIKKLTFDTRELSTNTLFIARKGLLVDTNKFIKDNLSANNYFIADEKWKDNLPEGNIIFVKDTWDVQARIANNFYDFPSKDLNIIGVTGTNGKTTVTYMIDYILSNLGKNTGMIGSIATVIFDETYTSNMTTHEAIETQEIFRKMVDKGVEFVSMEVSSQALLERRVEYTNFSVGVFTNLTQDHLDIHKDMESYFKAKAILFESIPKKDINGNDNYIILNAHDKYSKRIEEISEAKALYYGFDENCDYRAINIKEDKNSTEFDLIYRDEKYHFKSNFIGKYNVLNALAAIATCHVEGIDLASIPEIFQQIHSPEGRLEVISDERDDITVIVDYAHTPDALEKTCKAITNSYGENLITIIASTGDRDKLKRPILGDIACKYSKLAIFASDDNKTENPSDIFADMLRGLDYVNYMVIPNRVDAVNYAILNAKKDDIVLLAGRGHEDTFTFFGEIQYLKDKDIGLEAIENRRKLK